MNMREFSAINRRRCESVDGFNHRLSDWSLSDWLVAVGGELGEAMNIAKKLNRVRDRIPGNDLTPDQLRDAFEREIADTFIYLDLVAQAAGFQLADIVPDVFDAKSISLGCPIRYREGPDNLPPGMMTRDDIRARIRPGENFGDSAE
jgi:hypothetical protein